MSEKKMIIRNCPALYQINGMTNECLGTDYQCQDCTDCIIKQIVELCGKYQVIDAGYQKAAINYLASDILKLLDIEDAEDENSQS